MKRKASTQHICLSKYIHCEQSSALKKTRFKIDDTETDFMFEFPDGKITWTHKEVLVRNEVFRAAIESNMEESIKNKWKVEPEESEGMRKLLVFLYTQELEITSENMCNLFLVAAKYNEHNMAAHCAESMLAMMNDSNCVAVWYLLSQCSFRYAECADIAMDAFVSIGTPRALLKEKDEVIAYYMRRHMLNAPRDAMALICALDETHDKMGLMERYLHSTDPTHIFTVDIKRPADEDMDGINCSNYVDIEMFGRIWEIEVEYRYTKDKFLLYIRSKEYIPRDMELHLDLEISYGPTKTVALFEIKDTSTYYGKKLSDIKLGSDRGHIHSVALSVCIRNLTLVPRKRNYSIDAE